MPKYPSTGPRPDPTQTGFGRSPIDRGQGDPGGDRIDNGYGGDFGMPPPGPGLGTARGNTGPLGSIGGLQGLISRRRGEYGGGREMGRAPGGAAASAALFGGAPAGGTPSRYPQSWVNTYNQQSPGTQAAMAGRFGGMSPGQIMNDWNTNIAPNYAPGTDPGAILGGAPDLAHSGVPGAGTPLGKRSSKGASAALGHQKAMDARATGAQPPAVPPGVFGDPAGSLGGGGSQNLMGQGGISPGWSGPAAGTGVASGEGLQGLIRQRRQQGASAAPGGLGT